MAASPFSPTVQLWSGTIPQQLSPIGGTWRSSNPKTIEVLRLATVMARRITDQDFVALGLAGENRPRVWIRFAGRELIPVEEQSSQAPTAANLRNIITSTSSQQATADRAFYAATNPMYRAL